MILGLEFPGIFRKLNAERLFYFLTGIDISGFLTAPYLIIDASVGNSSIADTLPRVSNSSFSI